MKDRILDGLRVLVMAIVAVPLSLIAFIIVAWWLATNPGAGHPYRGGDDGEPD